MLCRAGAPDPAEKRADTPGAAVYDRRSVGHGPPLHECLIPIRFQVETNEAGVQVGPALRAGLSSRVYLRVKLRPARRAGPTQITLILNAHWNYRSRTVCRSPAVMRKSRCSAVRGSQSAILSGHSTARHHGEVMKSVSRRSSTCCADSSR